MQRDLFLVPEALNCTCRLLLLHLCVRSYYARWRTTLVSTPISRHLHESAVACTKAIYVSLSRYASSSNSGSGDPAAGGEKATQAEAASAKRGDGADRARRGSARWRGRRRRALTALPFSTSLTTSELRWAFWAASSPRRHRWQLLE